MINFRIARAYPSVRNEILCLITDFTTIEIIIEEAAKLYELTIGSSKVEARFYKNM